MLRRVVVSRCLIPRHLEVRQCSSTGEPPVTDLKSERAKRALLDRIIRVNHAGELGADRIYAGQMCVLGKTESGPMIKEMWEQEKEHLARFERLLSKHKARPTVFTPIWNVAGFVLGAGTAVLGKEMAMACTVAVEETIVEHYNNQLRELMEDSATEHKELIEVITKCRDEELEHHDTGLEHNAEQAPMYQLFKPIIQVGCRTAIWLSEKI